MKKLLGSLGASTMLLAFSVSSALAQDFVTEGAIATSNEFGSITDLNSILTWMYNIFRYLGWAGVFIGIGFVLFSLIYKLFNADNEEAMKTVQGYITKAVLIVIAGLLLLSLAWIITFVGGLFGYQVGTVDEASTVIDGAIPVPVGGGGS